MSGTLYQIDTVAVGRTCKSAFRWCSVNWLIQVTNSQPFIYYNKVAQKIIEFKVWNQHKDKIGVQRMTILIFQQKICQYIIIHCHQKSIQLCRYF